MEQLEAHAPGGVVGALRDDARWGGTIDERAIAAGAVQALAQRRRGYRRAIGHGAGRRVAGGLIDQPATPVDRLDENLVDQDARLAVVASVGEWLRQFVRPGGP